MQRIVDASYPYYESTAKFFEEEDYEGIFIKDKFFDQISYEQLSFNDFEYGNEEYVLVHFFHDNLGDQALLFKVGEPDKPLVRIYKNDEEEEVVPIDSKFGKNMTPLLIDFLLSKIQDEREERKRSDETKAKEESNDEEIEYWIEKLINLEEDHKDTTREEKKLAALYVKNPKEVLNVAKKLRYFNKSYIKNNIRTECKNLKTYDDEIFIVPDESSKQVLCYSESEFEDLTLRGEYNPFTLKGIKDLKYGTPVSSRIHLNNNAYKRLKFWVERTYTLGNVFYKVDEDSAREFAKTIIKDDDAAEGDNRYKLYRGMSFPTKDSFAAYNSKLNCKGEAYEDCNINFNSYTSWTYNYEVARKFANHFRNNLGVILISTFNYDELLVDVTKVANKLDYSNEFEVVCLPIKNKKCKVEFL